MRRYKLTIRTMSDSGNDEWEIDFDKYEQAKDFVKEVENKKYISWVAEDGDTIFIATDKIICMWIDSFEMRDDGKEKRTRGEIIGLILMIGVIIVLGWFATVNIILPALGK